MSAQDTASEGESTTSQDSTETNVDPVAEPARTRPPRRFPLLALLAFLLALAALGAAGWLWYDLTAPDPELDPVLAKLDEERERSARLEQRLNALEEQAATVGQQADRALDRQAAMENELQETRQLLSQADDQVGTLASLQRELAEELRGQMQQLWQREGQERQIDRDLELRLLLLEAASLLRIGQERAELTDDLVGARTAYRRASTLIQQADDPRLGNVRRHIARELDALETAVSPDWLRAQVQLERLTEDVNTWPLATPGDTEPAARPDDPAESPGWTGSLRNALGQLVRVRPRDEVELTDEQINAAREQMRMRLTAAELAVARRDTLELDHHLRAAQRDLQAWFDGEASEIQSARALMEELTGLETATLPVEFGQALAALRAHLEQL